MKTILKFICALLVTGNACALPPSPVVRIQKIEGIVIELPKGEEGLLYGFLKMRVTATTSPESI